MPRKKLQPKTEGQKLAEGFFPVDETNIKYAVEKHYKKIDQKFLETVEKPYKKIDLKSRETIEKKGKKKKTKPRKKSIKKEFKIPKIKLKPEGYELIITEKPQAALKIASALGKTSKKIVKGVPYYEVDREGKKLVVACAVGHLFSLSQDKPGAGIPRFDISWKPNSFVKKKDFSKKYYDVLAKLVKQAGSLTVATDYDVEGEVIGLNVVRFLAGQTDSARMKFSTLTDKEINKAYEEKSKTLDWGQAIAGETRHYLDWYYGINLSRALMAAIKTTGRFRIMSIGRVQGPSLKLIVEKEKQISSFKSEEYWQVLMKLKGEKINLLHNKDILGPERVMKGIDKLEKFNELEGKTALVQTKKTLKNLPPYPPFNLTNLQTEAYRLHGMKPSRTLQVAQSLYLSGLISYPRTSSQKLPIELNYKEILKKIAKIYNVENLISREKPIEGKKSDPAHPSIHPTGEFSSSLSQEEKKIYDLISKRFLSLFMEDAIVENKNIKAVCEGLTFNAKGSEIKKSSWLSICPSTTKEKKIKDINGDKEVEKIKFEEKETQPPKRFSPASIISELEKRNLGTKATRSSILETLYNRDYIKDTSIKATPLGISMIDTLEKYSPIITSSELTRAFEREMNSLRGAEKDFEILEKSILKKAQSSITKIAQQFKDQEENIGKELLKANLIFRENQREENKLNICPKCKKNSLEIKYSRKTKRYFIACDGYPDCKNTFSLPPRGTMKKAKGNCEKCGFVKIMAITRGRRPWIFCFNSECETNKERIEEYRKKKEYYFI
jgi:DNA topoisomerase-1